VPEAEVASRLSAKHWQRGWLMGWRDIALATDERTTVSGVIPRATCGDKYLLMMPAHKPNLCACLLAKPCWIDSIAATPKAVPRTCGDEPGFHSLFRSQPHLHSARKFELGKMGALVFRCFTTAYKTEPKPL